MYLSSLFCDKFFHCYLSITQQDNPARALVRCITSLQSTGSPACSSDNYDTRKGYVW